MKWARLGRTAPWLVMGVAISILLACAEERGATTPSDVQLAAFGGAISASAPGVIGGTFEPDSAWVCGSKRTACMTLLSTRRFECAVPALCETEWASLGPVTIVEDLTAPVSPPSVAQITYPAGFAGGVAPANTWSGLSNFREVHIALWLRFSPNFQSHGSGVNKVLHIWIAGVNRVVLLGRGEDLVPTIALQGIAAPYNDGRGTSATSVHLLPQIAPDAAMTRGAWHRIDLVLLANTPGAADGAATMFLNGRKIAHYTGIPFSPAGSNSRWEQLNWNPTWGGVGETVRQAMFLQLDHIVTRGRN